MGINYGGNHVLARQGTNYSSAHYNDGQIVADGATITLKGCAAGTGEARVYLDGTEQILASYTVTVSAE